MMRGASGLEVNMKKYITLFLIVSLLALSACGAAPSAQTEAPTQTAAATAEPSAEPTEAPTPEPTSGEESPYPILVKLNEIVTVDMNGDGLEEEVYYNAVTLDSGVYEIDQTLTIDGVAYLEDLDAAGFYMDNPHEYYAITDIDASDGVLELALMDLGASDDYQTSFFRYDGRNLTYIGSVSGLIKENAVVGSSVTFDGKGKISTYVRLNVFQTWFAAVNYTVGDDGKLALVPQETYLALNETDVTVLSDIAGYAKADASSEMTVIAAGEKLAILGTDNSEWVLARNSAAESVWLHISDGSYSIETGDGGSAYAWDVLDGLVLAD